MLSRDEHTHTPPWCWVLTGGRIGQCPIAKTIFRLKSERFADGELTQAGVKGCTRSSWETQAHLSVQGPAAGAGLNFYTCWVPSSKADWGLQVLCANCSHLQRATCRSSLNIPWVCSPLRRTATRWIPTMRPFCTELHLRVWGETSSHRATWATLDLTCPGEVCPSSRGG